MRKNIFLFLILLFYGCTNENLINNYENTDINKKSININQNVSKNTLTITTIKPNQTEEQQIKKEYNPQVLNFKNDYYESSDFKSK